MRDLTMSCPARWAALAFVLLRFDAAALAMEPLSDNALASVHGRDGMSFNLSNFALSGNAELRYYTGRNDASFGIGNLSASRSDNVDAPFADPYRLDVIAGAPGQADIVKLAFPQNLGGKEVWQFAYDFSVSANGIDNKAGSIVLGDLAYYGGGLQWSTPQKGDGLAFGYALRSELGSLALRPNGRAMANEQMLFSGVHVSAADADGNAVNAPWRIADVGSQPGIFNARTDSAGNSSLHLGIEWPLAGDAAIGSLRIDNLRFNSDVSGVTDLGASRIGAIQIQYLDIKFKP